VADIYFDKHIVGIVCECDILWSVTTFDYLHLWKYEVCDHGYLVQYKEIGFSDYILCNPSVQFCIYFQSVLLGCI